MGNARSLLGSTNGEEIDAHDAVMRINQVTQQARQSHLDKPCLDAPSVVPLGRAACLHARVFKGSSPWELAGFGLCGLSHTVLGCIIVDVIASDAGKRVAQSEYYGVGRTRSWVRLRMEARAEERGVAVLYPLLSRVRNLDFNQIQSLGYTLHVLRELFTSQ